MIPAGEKPGGNQGRYKRKRWPDQADLSFRPSWAFPHPGVDHCVGCNICSVACPVRSVNLSFPGPKDLGPQAERWRFDAYSDEREHLTLCSDCGICSRVCPHGVPVAEMIAQARARHVRRYGLSLRDRILAHRTSIGRLAWPLAVVIEKWRGNAFIRQVLDRSLGLHPQAPLPLSPPSVKSIRVTHRARSTPAMGEVVYLAGCSTVTGGQQVERSALAVLDELGFNVTTPPRGCCGYPQQAAGLFDSARSAARKQVDDLQPYFKRGLPVISTSATCTFQFKHGFRHVLGLGNSTDDDLSLAVRDIFEWLIEIGLVQTIGSRMGELKKRVFYHPSCDIMDQGMGLPVLQLLGTIPKLELELSRSESCGGCRSYGLKNETYPTALAIGQRLFDEIDAQDPDWVVSESASCREWIEHHTGVPARHPIEVVAISMGCGPGEH